MARDYANWLVACLTLDRVVRIASPYCARRLCTTRYARFVVLVLFAVICVPHIHAIVFSRAQKRTDWVCWEDPASTAGWVLAALVEFVVGYIVVIVVFVLNVILTCMIYRNRVPTTAMPAAAAAATARRRASPTGASSDAVNPALWVAPPPLTPRARGSTTDVVGRRSLQNRRLTRTLIGVATVFLVCETPRMISSVVVKFVDRSPPRRIILNASYVLSGVNHAANFFIYIVSSPRFRQLLVESLRRRPPVAAGPAAVYRQVAVVPDANDVAMTNAAVEALPTARLAVIDEIDLGVSEEKTEHAQEQPVGAEQAGGDAVSGATEKERKGAPTSSEGAESNSTACGDIYVQINLQLFFAADSQ